MLQRIYGTAFESQEALDEHLDRLEEARRRDHRVLGKDLDLYSIHDETGPGLIIWHPKGRADKAAYRRFLEGGARPGRLRARVHAPHWALYSLGDERSPGLL